MGCVLCLLRAVCTLLFAASACRLRFVVVGGVLFVSVFLACCVLFVACWSLFVDCCELCGVRCLLFVVCWMLVVV